jgi:hypothetical protein
MDKDMITAMMEAHVAATPTEDELRLFAEKWWSVHKYINFESWNDTLRRSSYPFELIRLPKELIAETLSLPETKRFHEVSTKYIQLIKPILNANKWDRFFAKLISRSAKDVLMDEDNHGKPKALDSVYDMLSSLVWSLRTFDDLCHLVYLDVPHLVIRPYIDFHPSEEWRILIEDGRIVGISQYYYDSDFGYSPNLIKNIEDKIRSFIYDTVKPNLQIESFVADVVTNGDSIKLLELNPFGLSDPCLFISYDNLDGSFRYNRNSKE